MNKDIIPLPGIKTLYQAIENAETTRWSMTKEQMNLLDTLTGKTDVHLPEDEETLSDIGKLPESKNAKEREKLIKEFIEKKLERLETFYRYGLSQAGWNKYKLINLEFDNQIICKKK